MTKIIKKQERISIKKSFFYHSKKNNKSVTLITQFPSSIITCIFLEKSVKYSQCFYKKNVILHYYVINVK